VTNKARKALHHDEEPFWGAGDCREGGPCNKSKKYQHFSLDYTDCINEQVACSILYKKEILFFNFNIEKYYKSLKFLIQNKEREIFDCLCD
jgi:hypothetical protein